MNLSLKKQQYGRFRIEEAMQRIQESIGEIGRRMCQEI